MDLVADVDHAEADGLAHLGADDGQGLAELGLDGRDVAVVGLDWTLGESHVLEGVVAPVAFGVLAHSLYA